MKMTGNGQQQDHDALGSLIRILTGHNFKVDIEVDVG